MPRRALVSGDAGFIGRNFTRYLIRDGWDVDGFDIKPQGSARPGTDARVFFPDNDTPYDLLIHAAAVVGGRVSIDGDPLGVAGNLTIDHAAFSWAVRTRTPMLYFSSSAMYPVGLQTHAAAMVLSETNMDVEHPCGLPDATYGWTKLTGEVLAGHARACGAHVSVVRPFSGYGPDQDLDYPFPSFIDRALRGDDPFEVWGTGEQVRDFIHVGDVYAASMAIMAEEYPHPVNLATGVPTSFLDLAGMVTRFAGYTPRIETHPDRPTGVAHRVGDPTRMLRFHTPKIALDLGIAEAMLTRAGKENG